jgi:outer membrane immunogenic protein
LGGRRAERGVALTKRGRTMKKTLIASIALVAASTGFASAADLPVKAAPMAPVVAPVWGWTGWYIGANIGGIWSDSEDTVRPIGCFVNPAILCGGPLTNNPLRTDVGNLNGSSNNIGVTGGGQFGYNWQMGTFLLGFETDINGSSLNASDTVTRPLAAPLVGILNHTVNEKLDWFGTVRGRAGFLVAPTWLLYVTGGLAYGDVKSNSLINFTAGTDTYVGSFSDTRVGWTVGGGAEWAFSPNWSAKIEYLFVDLGTVSYADTCVTPAVICGGFAQAPAYATDLKIRENIVRFGINYRFGGPVVARY